MDQRFSFLSFFFFFLFFTFLFSFFYLYTTSTHLYNVLLYPYTPSSLYSYLSFFLFFLSLVPFNIISVRYPHPLVPITLCILLLSL
ncbi:hypothetical protein F5H01DRAFT_57649 [Linnemannia elongata]|nr:hypothetical protein F5H01DRAFT_57649 [Linnemannia elongata]